jgi:hypothetical protein
MLSLQFDAMDTDGSKTLEISDFPDNLECEITTTLVSQSITKVKWVVVPKDSAQGESERAIPVTEEEPEEAEAEAGAETEDVPLAECVLSGEYQVKLDIEVLKVRSECDERISEIKSQYEEKLEAARTSHYQVSLENAALEYQSRLDDTIEKMQQDYDSKLEKVAGNNNNNGDYGEKLETAMESLRSDYDKKLDHLERRVSVAPGKSEALVPAGISHEEHGKEKTALQDGHLEAQRSLVAHQEAYRQKSDAWREELQRDLETARLDITRLEHELSKATTKATKLEKSSARELNAVSGKLAPAERKVASLQKELKKALRLMDADAEEFEIFVVDDPTGALPEECGEYTNLSLNVRSSLFLLLMLSPPPPPSPALSALRVTPAGMSICTPGDPQDAHIRKPWSEVSIHADAATDPDNMDELFITLGKVRACSLRYCSCLQSSCLQSLRFATTRKLANWSVRISHYCATM